jgi:transcriptional regulator with GAF, ATPase, and Fis domain
MIGSTRIVVVASSRDSVRPETHGPVVGTVASGSDVVAVDPAMVSLLALVRRLAASDLPVLVQGETGSGKEVVARLLHRHSRRAGREFLGVNCAALPESLAESELFGHERGSFTGADARKGGVFERADGGTLLLDEVGELSTPNQARLLRVLQEHTLTRVGGTRAVPVDVRVVAATNRDLLVDVARGRFREDLYFRLNGVTVAVPPLRSRPRDIVPMAERVLAERGGGWHLGQGVAAVLQSYRWPGNVRELRNAIECAIALAEGSELRVEHLPPAVRGDLEPTVGDEPSGLRTKVDDLERRSILAALDAAGWNQSRAAQNLGISRRGLIYKMERHGLKPRPASGHGE